MLKTKALPLFALFFLFANLAFARNAAGEPSGVSETSFFQIVSASGTAAESAC
ncbi:MAG: hypothetical protein GXP32_00280 [Kiritimatiellaeota bacterium]|nr:hypothetical protein [Kiritimatiellota bacterium]